MSDDLLIKVNADVKDVQKKFDDITEESQSLQDTLSEMAKISAVAFAALTAEVGFSVKAFSDSAEVTNRLSAALQNQGIYSKELIENYEAQADALQALTGVDDDRIKSAQIALQAQLGAIPVTKELTKAVLDFATLERLDVVSAADLVGKSIGSSTNALTRYGIQIDTAAPKSQKLAQVIAQLEVHAGGQAEALGKGVGIFKIFGATLDDVQKKLGEKFAPALEVAASNLNALFNGFQNNQEAVDFAAAIIAAGAALTGIVTGIALAGNALIVLRAALLALNVQLTVTEALFAALGIGLVVAAVTELVLHFGQLSGAVKAIIADFGQLSTIATGTAKILGGMAHLDFDKVKEGVSEVGEAFKKMGHDAAAGWNEANQATKGGEEVQDAAKKAAAEKRQAEEKKTDQDSRNLAAAKKDFIVGQINNESQEVLALRKEEISELDALSKSQDAKEKELLRSKYKQTKDDLVEQQTQDKQIRQQFYKEDAAARKEHGNESVEMTTEANRKEIAAIQASTETEGSAQKKVYTDDLKARVKAHNTFLEEQKKYGTAYATINAAIHSNEVEGINNATQNLVALQQSQNSTLKTVGKEAATAQIVIKTAQAAMNVYEGFSAIPIIGPALGIAAAAAAVAYGAEQLSAVQGAQSGGMVAGTGSGDKVPFMLEPGELISPKQNFNEVVESVATSRGYTPPGAESGGAGYAEVVLSLQGDLMDFIEAKLVQRKFLNISLQGSR